MQIVACLRLMMVLVACLSLSWEAMACVSSHEMTAQNALSSVQNTVIMAPVSVSAMSAMPCCQAGHLSCNLSVLPEQDAVFPLMPVRENVCAGEALLSAFQLNRSLLRPPITILN